MKNIIELYSGKIIFSLLALIFTGIVSTLIKKSIDVVFHGVKGRITREGTLAKTRTIRRLIKNVLDGILYFMAGLVILSRWGVDIGPILTGAGIIGLGFSFGSQTLVKDVIAGFFIITENQFNLGDKIKVGNYEGIVDNITLRLTVLKDKKGNLIYLPNSQITTLIRYSPDKKN